MVSELLLAKLRLHRVCSKLIVSNSVRPISQAQSKVTVSNSSLLRSIGLGHCEESALKGLSTSLIIADSIYSQPKLCAQGAMLGCLVAALLKHYVAPHMLM